MASRLLKEMLSWALFSTSSVRSAMRIYGVSGALRIIS